MGSGHNLDDIYNLEEDKKRNIIIDNLNSPDSIREYFFNLRNEIRRLYSSIDEGNKLSQIDAELKYLLDKPELSFLKEFMTNISKISALTRTMRNEYIFLFDVVFFNLEELALRSIPQGQSSETLSSSEFSGIALDKKVREVVAEYLSQNERKECTYCHTKTILTAKYCIECGQPFHSN